MALIAPTLELNGIAYQEPEGSCVLELGDTIRGRRTFNVNWADRIDFATELLGSVKSDGKDPPSFIRIAPQAFPDYPKLVCTNATINGAGEMSANSDSEPVYELARIDAVYSPVSEERDGASEEEQVIATLDIDWQSEFLLCTRKTKFKWSTAPNSIIVDSVDVGLSKLISKVAQAYTRDHLPVIPVATIFATLGKINSAAWHGNGEGQLLFTGATSRRVTNAEGGTEYNLTYNFVWREASWNKFYNFDTRAWDFVQLVNGGGDWLPYETTDFSALFTNAS